MPTLGGIIFPFHYTWSKAVFGSTYIFENFKVSGGTIPRTTAAHHRESPPMSFTTTTRSSSRSSTSPFRSRKSSDPPPDTTRRTTKPQATKPSQPPPLSSSSSSSHKVKENVTVTARLRPLNSREIGKGDEVTWFANGDYSIQNEFNPAFAYGFES
ncbi:putative kinesin motor domain-containing protein [Helianthus annuus]|nr:putative kinesin motor domain-containing protein [Helianthus annuus]KAJ0697306.1 putative kinesin motor domain-containing protein [Helianthus annuus]